MQEFLEVIREECGAPQWSKGVTLARDKAVMLQNKSPAEVECLVITQNGLNTFEVVLYLEDEDWSCSCNGDCCAHVAAATIALKQNKFRAQDDESKSEGKSAAPHPQPIQYHLEDGKFGLNIRRKFKVGNELCNIEGSIGLLVKGETHTRPVLIRHMDHAFERYIGMRTVVTASRSQLQRFFKYLKDCDQIYYDGKKVALVGTTTGVILDISDHPQGYWVELKQDKSFHKLIGKAVLLKKDKAYLLESELLMSPNVQAYRHGCVVHPTRTAKLVAEVIPQLQGNTEICNHSKFKLPSLVTTSAEVSFHIEKGTYSYDIVPQIVYGNPPLARVENGQLITLGNQVPRRNIPKEEELKKTLQQELGLQPSQQNRLPIDEALDIMSDMKRIGQVPVKAQEQLTYKGKLEPQIQFTHEEFLTNFEAIDSQSGKTTHLGADKVIGAWENGHKFIESEGGGYLEVPTEWLQVNGKILANMLHAKSESGKLAPFHIPELARILENSGQPLPPALHEARNRIENFKLKPLKLPPDFKACLRHYQEEGAQWAANLRNLQLGGILADDMGLGKTIQTLAIIEKRTLIVAPTSVFTNWRAELERFRPELKVSAYYGSARQLDQEADVILTTYGLLRRDVEVLSEHPWDNLILDESQAIKNAKSQVAKAAFKLARRADFRLALSGTPIENDLTELWSQMNFVNPGLLGDLNDFSTTYGIQNIQEGKSPHLRNRISPFILRRLKSQVALELPSRTDVILRCQLTEDEREVYDTVLSTTQKEVIEKLGASAPPMKILEALLRLRQACCHATLLPGVHFETSSKTQLLAEQLQRVILQGHKALVFSQWTSLLDLVEPLLKELKLKYCRLDGSTRDRQGVVDTFQSATGTNIMLISLKAGGTGLNLTEADHVYILDPWWNPAVEEQAANRAHRIGQTKPVFIHRIIAENSVEEKIMALQNKKRELAEASLEGTHQLRLDRQELLALFH